jgi:outer membrane lipoprotein-sorting protein
MRRSLSRAAFVLLLLPVAAVAGAQSVDEIVAKNLQAKGGADKWKTVSSVKMTGKITMQAMQGMEFPLTVYAKRPNYTRQEFVIQDRKIVQGFDGTTGWMINPMTGTEVPQEMPPAVSEVMKNTSDFDGPLVDYKAKGNTIELVGKEKLGTKDVYHLKVTTKGAQVQHYFLDATTGIEVKKAEEIEMGPGQKQTLETEMTDYQQVEGVMVPRTIKQLMNGAPVVQMSIDKVEFNSALDDTFFKMPKK